MRYIADLHIHSKYSRACSKELTPENIAKWCEIKGINIVSTADFTHPAWFAELKEKLEPAETGLYKLRDGLDSRLRGNDTGRGGNDMGRGGNDRGGVRFLVSTELSCIYKRNGKTRRVHLCVWMPSLQAAEKFTKMLIDRECNVRSDGRPILGIDSEEILKMALMADSNAMVIPAHAWTPWFSVFGSESGFDSLEECFGKNAKYIHAIETGLSSDPPMNWRLSALDNITLISNSDAHSLEKLGREANVFDFSGRPDYKKICEAIKTRADFSYTIEFFPEEGKYHLDGHRACGVCLSPEETKKHNLSCPQCKKPVTVGVMHRVSALADRLPHDVAAGYGRVPYKSVVPLKEILSECFDVGVKSKKISIAYDEMIKKCRNEFYILLDASQDELRRCGGELLAEAVSRMREKRIFIRPGYDGEFGIVKIFSPEERQELSQKSLF